MGRLSKKLPFYSEREGRLQPFAGVTRANTYCRTFFSVGSADMDLLVLQLMAREGTIATTHVSPGNVMVPTGVNKQEFGPIG